MSESDRDSGTDKILDLLDELHKALKQPDVHAHLTERGINASLALLVADGLRAYLQGRKKEAADDLSTAAEEIVARLGMGSTGQLLS